MSRPRVLVATNMWPGERHDYFGVFVQRQVEALREAAPDWTFDVFTMAGYRGRTDYLAAVPRLRRRLKAGYDLVHAHYGLTGATAAMAGARPLVMTLHGTDATIPWQKAITRAAGLRCAEVIAVSERLRDAYGDPSLPVISCGVQTELFRPGDRRAARERLGIPLDALVALFPAEPSNPIKDHALYEGAVARCESALGLPITRLALGVEGGQVLDRMVASDVVVLTSKEESGPLVVKEAIACGIPVVAVDVGDVPMTLRGLPDCAITPRDADRIGGAMTAILCSPGRGRSAEADAERRARVFELGLDEGTIARRVLALYGDVLRSRTGRVGG